MDVVKEIASTLRSTESMAESFANRVREKIGQDVFVPDQVILDVLKRLNPRSIEINKVVSEVRTSLNKQNRRTGNRSSKAQFISETPQETPGINRYTGQQKEPSIVQSESLVQAPKTMMDQIDDILKANWNRAEREGLKPERMGGNAFVNAVHKHTDPRDATRRRILKACKIIDSRDVLITPTIIADTIRERD